MSLTIEFVLKEFNVKLFSLILVLLLAFAIGSSASTLYVGNDTQSPVAVYTPAGIFTGYFGQTGATGSAIDAAGDIWTVKPGFGSNHVEKYNPGGTLLNSFTAPVGGQWIEDMSHGSGTSLWAGTFEGYVWELNDSTGGVLSSFPVPGSNFTGVAFDGTDLWLSGGFAANALYKYTTLGVLLATVPIGTMCGGLGYDTSDGTLYCGDFGAVHHYSTAGVLLGSFVTPDSVAYHDGLEVAGLTAPIPEPATYLSLGLGFLSLALLRRRK